MLNHDEDPRVSDFDYPGEEIEPFDEDAIENKDESVEAQIEAAERRATRAAGHKFISQMMAVLNFFHEARTFGELSARLWVVSSAMDHPSVRDFDSNTQIADRLGITKADYSKHLVNFQRYNRLPPSGFQKRVAAREAYRKSRKAQLHKIELQ